MSEHEMCARHKSKLVTTILMYKRNSSNYSAVTASIIKEQSRRIRKELQKTCYKIFSYYHFLYPPPLFLLIYLVAEHVFGFFYIVSLLSME